MILQVHKSFVQQKQPGKLSPEFAGRLLHHQVPPGCKLPLLHEPYPTMDGCPVSPSCRQKVLARHLQRASGPRRDNRASKSLRARLFPAMSPDVPTRIATGYCVSLFHPSARWAARSRAQVDNVSGCSPSPNPGPQGTLPAAQGSSGRVADCTPLVRVTPIAVKGSKFSAGSTIYQPSRNTLVPTRKTVHTDGIYLLYSSPHSQDRVVPHISQTLGARSYIDRHPRVMARPGPPSTVAVGS